MQLLRLSPLIALLMLSFPAAGSAAEEDEALTLRIIGRNTAVMFADGGFMLDAKVDTGADSTSVDARNIETFERDGEKWVRFEIVSNNDRNLTLERPIVSDVTIIQASGARQERYVVKLDLCVGDLLLPTEVNLANREGLDFRMLLGREFLIRGHFLVNPAEEFKAAPNCDDVVER